MELRYNPDTVEESLDALVDLKECVEDMKSSLESIKEDIISNNSGEAISKIEEVIDSKLEELVKVDNNLTDFNEYITRYIEGIEEADYRDVISSDYYIDYDEIIEYIKSINDILENDEYSDLSRRFENNIDNFNEQKNKYKDVDNSIDIEEEYEEDESTKRYIYRREDEIEQEISNQRNNEEIMEEVELKLKRFRS